MDKPTVKWQAMLRLRAIIAAFLNVLKSACQASIAMHLAGRGQPIETNQSPHQKD